MITTLLVLAGQVALSPCAIEGVRPPAKCGTYRVWENRESRQGRQIDLNVIVLEAFGSPKRPDPMFFFAGGPGDAPSFNARFFSRVFEGVRQWRDLVLVDLRGTGKSAPLWCPELDQPDASGVFDADEMSASAVRACRARFERQLVDLRQYTTEIVVDDLDEVRQALGYARINVYGTSYGTRVAQVYMRRHPGSLRVVTMKGIVPPSMAMPENHAREGERAWQSLVARCNADVNCARMYPTLDAEFRELLTHIDNPSRVITLPASPERPAVQIKVTSGLFAEAFRNMLYSPDTAVQAPLLVRNLLGNERGLAETALSARRMLGGERLSAGFFLSVTCAEDVPYLPKDWSPMVKGTFGGDYRLRQQTAACAEWPRGQVSARHRQPTRSGIPTLIFSGEFDPVTPASGGEEVMKGLGRGRHVIVRNNGHPIGNAEACIASIIAAAVDKGSVDGLDQSCAAAITSPPFPPPPVVLKR